MNEDNLVIYQKWIDATKDAYNLLKRFPKEEKFILASQIRETVIDCGALILDINEERTSEEKLRKAMVLDSKLKRIRVLFRLAMELTYISQKNYLTICNKWEEIGRILGGWKKSFQPRSQGWR